jgi:hypothetical protein
VPTAATRLPAAATPTPVSIIEPTMVPIPWAPASRSWSRAAARPPALASLTLTSVAAPRSITAFRSASVNTASSAITGVATAAVTRARPSRSVAGTGCSTSSTPAPESSSSRITRIAWSGVQPWLASSRITTDGPTAERTARTRATSVAASVPTLSFSAVNPSATRSRAAAASGRRPRRPR